MSDKSIQDQIGMADSFEEALRLITENPPKEGKKNIQPISMSLITADPDLFQGREGLDQEGLRDYREAAEDGAKFPPLVVFCDTSNYKFYLVDGYHRHTLYKELGYRWAECNILFGTKREAIEYAVSANVSTHGIRLKEADKKKAAFMLFSLPGWLDESNTLIARKIGCSSTSIERWVSEYLLKNNMDHARLATFKRRTKTGTVKVCRRPAPVIELQHALDRIHTYNSNGKTYFRVATAKRNVHVGNTLEKAKARVAEMFEAGDFLVGKKVVAQKSFTGMLRPGRRSYFRVWLHKQGVIVHQVIDNGRDARSIQESDLYNYWFDGGIIKVCENASQENFSQLVGDVVLAATLHGPRPQRKVIISAFPDNCGALMEMASNAGVECLTPDEFVATFSGQDAESA